MTKVARKAFGIEKFDGKDFGFWRMQIEDYLYGKKLHLLLLGKKPGTMKAEKWALLDRQVLGVIKLTLSSFVAHNVVKEKTTADLMKALSGMYEKLSAKQQGAFDEEIVQSEDGKECISSTTSESIVVCRN